tara:strand:+ start:1938 stop:3146 length:1209 start_codon:yes stop_codon:yes gene_type:complete
MLDFFLKDAKYKNYKLYLLFIYFLWLTSLLTYFYLSEFVKAGGLENGVKLGNDSLLYLREARSILNGDSSVLELKSKFGFIIFLIPFIYFDLPLYNVVLFQIILTSVSAFYLYRITEKYFCKLSGVICIALFLFYFPIQIRNFYILTEMLFINLSIILIYLIVFFKKKYLPLVIILLLSLISLRPNGMLFLFSICISLFIFLKNKKKNLYLSFYVAILLIISIVVINFLNAYLQDLDLINNLNLGIIWGYSFKTMNICKASCLSIDLINNNYPNTILGFIQFVSMNFIEYLKIFFYKIFWMILRARPYYSDVHNLYSLLFDVILYPSFIYGFIKRPKNLFSLKCINYYMLLSIILVGLTFADWSGRFSLYILPFVMVFSSYGLLIFIKKILNMINQKWNNAA